MRTALVLAVARAGCYRDTATPATPANQALVVAPRTPSPSRDILAYLPASSSIVITIDANRLRSSMLWQKFTDFVARKLGPPRPGTEKCMALLSGISSVTFGVVEGDASSSTAASGVAVVRGLQRERALECMRSGGSEASITEDHGVFATQVASGRSALLTFVDPTTLVVVLADEPTRAQLDAIIAGGAALRKHAEFMELYEQREPEMTLWLAVFGNATTLSRALAGMHMRALYGSLGATDTVSAALHFQLETPDQATTFGTMLDTSVRSMVTTMFENADVRTDDDVTTLSLVMTEEKFSQLWTMMAQMF